MEGVSSLTGGVSAFGGCGLNRSSSLVLVFSIVHRVAPECRAVSERGASGCGGVITSTAAPVAVEAFGIEMGMIHPSQPHTLILRRHPDTPMGAARRRWELHVESLQWIIPHIPLRTVSPLPVALHDPGW